MTNFVFATLQGGPLGLTAWKEYLQTIIVQLKWFACLQWDTLTPAGASWNYIMSFYVDVCRWEYVCRYTDPLQRVNSGVVLSGLQVFGEEAVGDRGEFLIARISLALVPGVSHFRDAQPLLLWHLCQFPLWRDGKERINKDEREMWINLIIFSLI